MWKRVKRSPFFSKDSVSVNLGVIKLVGCPLRFLDDFRKGVCESRHEYIQSSPRFCSRQITVVVVHVQGAEDESKMGKAFVCIKSRVRVPAPGAPLQQPH